MINYKSLLIKAKELLPNSIVEYGDDLRTDNDFANIVCLTIENYQGFDLFCLTAIIDKTSISCSIGEDSTEEELLNSLKVAIDNRGMVCELNNIFSE